MFVWALNEPNFGTFANWPSVEMGINPIANKKTRAKHTQRCRIA